MKASIAAGMRRTSTKGDGGDVVNPMIRVTESQVDAGGPDLHFHLLQTKEWGSPCHVLRSNLQPSLIPLAYCVFVLQAKLSTM